MRQRAQLIAFAALLLPAIVTRRSATARHDVILRHGIIVDGAGAPRYRADVAIAGGSIARGPARVLCENSAEAGSPRGST